VSVSTRVLELKIVIVMLYAFCCVCVNERVMSG
jgi:hypothetical protein